MKERCPNHELIAQGVLRDFKWIISKRGYANIVESKGDYVWGVIYRINLSDEAELDRREGVSSGSYIKKYLDIEGGSVIYNCLVYVDPVVQVGVPKKEYIIRINKGLIDSKLPEDYVKSYIRKYIPEISVEA